MPPTSNLTPSASGISPILLAASAQTAPPALHGLGATILPLLPLIAHPDLAVTPSCRISYVGVPPAVNTLLFITFPNVYRPDNGAPAIKTGLWRIFPPVYLG